MYLGRQYIIPMQAVAKTEVFMEDFQITACVLRQCGQTMCV